MRRFSVGCVEGEMAKVCEISIWRIRQVELGEESLSERRSRCEFERLKGVDRGEKEFDWNSYGSFDIVYICVNVESLDLLRDLFIPDEKY